jgi:putative transposase
MQRVRPGIFNTDQGSQFTSESFTHELERRDVRISMDDRGPALDNVFIERLWRSVKYEDIYLRDFADGHAVHQGLTRYFRFYNHERPHSSLGNQRPAEVYRS